MKKILLFAFAAILCSCSKDEQDVFTKEQENVFALLIGTWADTNCYPQVPPTKITFGRHYIEPEPIYKDEFPPESAILFEQHGECSVYRWFLTVGVEGVEGDGRYEIDECYYYVSPNADYFCLYWIGGLSVSTYKMKIDNGNQITLHDTEYLDQPPLIFIKE